MSSAESQSMGNIDIPMNSFLDFLKITCQVNDSILNKDGKSCPEIDYNKLANNEIINSLLLSKMSNDMKASSHDSTEDQCKPLESKPVDKSRGKSNARFNSTFRKSQGDTSANGVPYIHPALSNKLEDVINEGILDSVLPFICPPSSSFISNHPNNKSNKAGSKLQEQSSSVFPKVVTYEAQEKKEDTLPKESVPPGSRSPRLASGGGGKVKETRVVSSKRKSACHPRSAVDDTRGE